MVRKIKAKLVLRLRSEGLSVRQIAARGLSRHSVAAVLEGADREKLAGEDVAGLDAAAVYARLFPDRGVHESVHAQPDWRHVHRELARVGVTLKLLHSGRSLHLKPGRSLLAESLRARARCGVAALDDGGAQRV